MIGLSKPQQRGLFRMLDVGSIGCVPRTVFLGSLMTCQSWDAVSERWLGPFQKASGVRLKAVSRCHNAHRRGSGEASERRVATYRGLVIFEASGADAAARSTGSFSDRKQSKGSAYCRAFLFLIAPLGLIRSPYPPYRPFRHPEAYRRQRQRSSSAVRPPWLRW
jgi:hypothetical protein